MKEYMLLVSKIIIILKIKEKTFPPNYVFNGIFIFISALETSSS